MNTHVNLARCRHRTATVGLLAIGCLLVGVAQAQPPPTAAPQRQGGSLQAQVAALQTQVTALQAQVAALQSQVATDTIPNVSGYVTMDLSNPSRPTLRVAGANLQVVNGLGATNTVNGLGNVIVGYDEVRAFGRPECSIGYYPDETSCTAHGGTWITPVKTGSHNVVIGREHAYSQFGGLVAGYRNLIAGAESSVLGGVLNTASGHYATVSGGSGNRASSNGASVSGGSGNTASYTDASVSGGRGNTASGYVATVSGGYANSATALAASVSGGYGNVASQEDSSVSGGVLNTASGANASVSGGYGNTASKDSSSVSGGVNRTQDQAFGWTAGALTQPQ